MAHPKALNDTPEPIRPGQPQARNPTTPGDLAETYARCVRAHYLDRLQHEQIIGLVDSCRRINGSLSA